MSTQARRELLVGVETLERCRGGQSGLAMEWRPTRWGAEEFTESTGQQGGKEWKFRARTSANSSGSGCASCECGRCELEFPVAVDLKLGNGCAPSKFLQYN